tara:strand:- start:265 stop:459 length:195 start_codon:yes stop_codon:yes gene_type:complete
MIEQKQNKITQKQADEYLNTLRLSGQINMFGAAPSLQEIFGITRYDAVSHLTHWMDNFSKGEEH